MSLSSQRMTMVNLRQPMRAKQCLEYHKLEVAATRSSSSKDAMQCNGRGEDINQGSIRCAKKEVSGSLISHHISCMRSFLGGLVLLADPCEARSSTWQARARATLMTRRDKS